MKYIYLLLFILVLYYLLSNISQKYSNQEDFDPSLVPVSSIVTLAKVAQKLVDGGGTLTNPGNLQIGTPSAPGNLIVTGTNTTTGAVQLQNTLNVNGLTTLSSDLNVTGNSAIGGTLGVTGDTTLNGATTLNGDITLEGASQTNNKLTVNNVYTTFSGSISGDGKPVNSPGQPQFIVKNPNNLAFVGTNTKGDDYNWNNVVSIDHNANVVIGGQTPTTLNTKSSGNLTVNGGINTPQVWIGGPSYSSLVFNAREGGEISQIYSQKGDTGISMYSNLTGKDIFNVDKNGNATIPGNLYLNNGIAAGPNSNTTIRMTTGNMPNGAKVTIGSLTIPGVYMVLINNSLNSTRNQIGLLATDLINNSSAFTLLNPSGDQVYIFTENAKDLIIQNWTKGGGDTYSVVASLLFRYS